MLARKKEADDSLGTARCGRCAQILPDETLTYCHTCGVPFSRIPPTSSFHLLKENKNLSSRNIRSRTLGAVALFGFFVWTISALFLELRNQALVTEFTELRPLNIFLHEREEFPKIGRVLAEASVTVAKQAFKDHFQMDIKQVSFSEEELQAPLRFLGRKDWNPDFSKLDFWARFSNDTYTQSFFKSPSQELKILITNIPVVADHLAKEKMELRHLNSQNFVSGLSHPGFIFISSYRMNNSKSEFAKNGVSLDSFEAKARYLGEYVMAHELGHSLLALEDSVFELEDSSKKTKLRGLASVANGYAECLMHSDAGGGFWAASQLQVRNLGQPSKCRAYEAVVLAFHKRAESFRLLRDGKRKEAEVLHQEALRLIENKTQSWLTSVWQKESSLFENSFRRWIRGFFMFQ